MEFTDFLIIYLACGAPFGVYHFVQNRKSVPFGRNLTGALLRFACWIPFAVAMVVRRTSFSNLYNLGFDGASSLDSKKSRQIAECRRRIEDLAANLTNMSVFDCREIVERFIGLSEEFHQVKSGSPPDAELFVVADHPDRELASVCLRRQIRRKLEFHLELARRDLLSIADSAGSGEEPDALRREIARIEALLTPTAPTGDGTAGPKQNAATLAVSSLENELWQATQYRSPKDTRVSLNMNSIGIATKLSSKD